MTALTRDIRSDDIATLLVMNTAAVPAVNELEEGGFRALVGECHQALVVVEGEGDHPDQALGFVLALLPGAEYGSENYRWFSARSNSFLYVDRIVISEGARNRRLGKALYEKVFEAAAASGSAEVFCEVNLEPPNPGSLAFHQRLGFVEVGQQATKGGSVVVALLARRVRG